MNVENADRDARTVLAKLKSGKNRKLSAHKNDRDSPTINRNFLGIYLWPGRQYENGLVKTPIGRVAIKTPVKSIHITGTEKPPFLFSVTVMIINIVMRNAKKPKNNPRNQRLLL